MSERLFRRPHLRQSWFVNRVLLDGLVLRRVGGRKIAYLVEPCDRCAFEGPHPGDGYLFEESCPFCWGKGGYYLRLTRRQRHVALVLEEQWDKDERRFVRDRQDAAYEGFCWNCNRWGTVLGKSNLCVRCYFGDRLKLYQAEQVFDPETELEELDREAGASVVAGED